MDTDYSKAIEREKLILTKDNIISKILSKSHYFNCFSYELDCEDSDDSRNNEDYDPYLELDFQSSHDRNYGKKNNFLSSFSVDLLDFSFPQKMKALSINSHRDTSLKIPDTFNTIIRLSSRVLREIWVSNFCISAPQFKRLMVAYKHVHSILLDCCKISVPAVFDFSKLLKNTHIEKLDFACVGEPEYSDWEGNPQEFINLIQGLATSLDLKLSLRKIIATGCGVEMKKVRKILHQNGFYNVKLRNETFG
ncbi:unnamed protein product [Moneuplotes crassus]|uniref:Uncharacterized protein n=1 Tax=Euplotes crassus TaxID=5936 RepID=A0AAD1UN72_EUPCR|nr:unnamed protein product [Moneuplotes crassus]